MITYIFDKHYLNEKNKAWFQPHCTREQAEQKLQSAQVGEYIVRSSSRQQSLAFSYKSSVGVKHSLIEIVAAGYRITDHDLTYSTLEQLLQSEFIQKMLYREFRKASKPELVNPNVLKKNDSTKMLEQSDFKIS